MSYMPVPIVCDTFLQSDLIKSWEILVWQIAPLSPTDQSGGVLFTKHCAISKKKSNTLIILHILIYSLLKVNFVNIKYKFMYTMEMIWTT